MTEKNDHLFTMAIDELIELMKGAEVDSRAYAERRGVLDFRIAQMNEASAANLTRLTWWLMASTAVMALSTVALAVVAVIGIVD